MCSWQILVLKSGKNGNKSVAWIAVAQLYVDLWCDGAPAAAFAKRPHKPSTADV